MALRVKNPPAKAGDVRDTGSISAWRRSLEEGTATHSGVLAWEIPWTEEAGGLSPWGHRVGHDQGDLAHTAPGPEIQRACLPQAVHPSTRTFIPLFSRYVPVSRMCRALPWAQSTAERGRTPSPAEPPSWRKRQPEETQEARECWLVKA